MTSVILAAILSASQSAFVTDDVKVSEARVIYSDPEFCDELSQMVFWDYSAGSLNAEIGRAHV